MSFAIRFWGVRGSIACPSSKHISFGGNTSCVQVMVGDRNIILDAGTGIRGLGHEFLKKDVRNADLLLSHTHWDHINGFPFFAPAFQAGRTVRILGGHIPVERGGVRYALSGQMTDPMFPVPLEAMRAQLVFEDFVSGDTFNLAPGVRVRTTGLNHPNGATGYRIEYAGKSFCYVTDTEHVVGKPDQNILALIEGADLVVYDSTYTDNELPAHVGWGHSTWQEGVRLSQMAKVKKLAIFHHDPDHDDRFMAKVEKDAKKIWKGAFAAREGKTIKLK